MTQEIEKAKDRLWGRDVYFDLKDPSTADVQVSASGDYIIADGAESLRQAIIRRLLTSPGEWAALPDYGGGLREFVKKRSNSTTKDELAERVRSQCESEARVEKVESVIIEDDGEGTVKVAVQVRPVARLQSQATMEIGIEVN